MFDHTGFVLAIFSTSKTFYKSCLRRLESPS